MILVHGIRVLQLRLGLREYFIGPPYDDLETKACIESCKNYHTLGSSLPYDQKTQTSRKLRHVMVIPGRARMEASSLLWSGRRNSPTSSICQRPQGRQSCVPGGA